MNELDRILTDLEAATFDMFSETVNGSKAEQFYHSLMIFLGELRIHLKIAADEATNEEKQ